MKFLRIRVGRFGSLRDASLGGDDPLGGLVAVLGPNEAGKSTVHHILLSILFGFRPASRDAHPYTPWDGGDIDISADLELDDGRRLAIQRRLAGTPSGHLVHPSHEAESLANRDVPEVGHIDRRVFSEVYGISQIQLASLGKSTWAAVQDDLVTGLGAQDLRAPRTVAKRLEDAANQLWRADARGKPRSRAIEATLAEEAETRRRAADRDHELRDVRREIVVLTSERASVEQEVEQARARRSTLRELVPLARTIEEMDCLQAGVRNPEALTALPRDPKRVWQEIRGRVERADARLEGLSSEKERARSAANALPESDRLILERAETLEELSARSALLDEWYARTETARTERVRLEQEVAERSPRILGGPDPLGLGDALAERIRTVDLGRLSAAMERLDEARRLAAESVPAHAEPRTNRGTAGALVVAALVALATGLWFGVPVVWAPALVALGFGVVGLRGTGRPRRIDRPGMEERGDPADIEAAERQVRSALEPLQVPASEPVRAGLAERVEAIQTLLRDRDARSAEIEKMDRERQTLAERLARAVEGLGEPMPDDLREALPRIKTLLGEARAREQTASEAERTVARLDKEIEDAAAESRAAKDALEAFEQAIAAAGGVPSDDGLDDLSDRRKKLDDLERLEREITARHGGNERARARLEELARGVDRGDRDVEAAEAAVDGLEVRIRQIESRKSALEERERGLLERETVDVVDGRIERLQDELRTARREHDRLLVLSRLLSKAEERFRAERQPGLLGAARTYLDRITAGRYGRILVGDRAVGGGFLLDAEHLPEPHEVEEPLSLGTREQVYLALRLAIADHLDQGRESLPLLLDEVLANWDPDRRRRALTLLAEEARRRQVFVFTCHPHIADEIGDLGGTVVDLSNLSSPPDEVPGRHGQPELELDLE